MRRVAALLAAVLLAPVLEACGGGGAEPGASRDATVILDFQPNAVHAGLYSALRRGFFSDRHVRLRVREPSESTDAPKLLRAGRAEFAILDIHDLGLAAQRGFDVVGVAPIVERPLAALLARRSGPVRRPRDLDGRRAGVTGLPSDDAVLDSEVAADGGDPAAVHRVTIGFNAVASLAAGKVDAATAFWNAEGVALRRRGIAVREFRVDDYGAPRYPELVLATTRRLLRRDPELVRSVVAATERGYRFTLDRPQESVGDLAKSVPGIDRGLQAAELRGLLPALRPVGRLDPATLARWGRWDAAHGILDRPPRVRRLFPAVSAGG
jgi:NitT/TauT family transport system substrate-binding protein/putative hydroxymethylpyrimidine transport system substrate-binding protein